MAFDGTNSVGGIRKVAINISRYSVWVKRIIDRNGAITTVEPLLERFNRDLNYLEEFNVGR